MLLQEFYVIYKSMLCRRMGYLIYKCESGSKGFLSAKYFELGSFPGFRGLYANGIENEMSKDDPTYSDGHVLASESS